MIKFLNLLNAGTLVKSVMEHVSALSANIYNTFKEVYGNLETIDSETVKKSDITYNSATETLTLINKKGR